MKDNKVTGIVVFHNQERFKERVLESINYQVDQLVVVENQGSKCHQKEVGLKQAKHELIFFCDGDVLVEKGSVQAAKRILDEDEGIMIVGGRVTTECKTPSDELMYILRHRFFEKKRDRLSDCCYLVRKKIFDEGCNFSRGPHAEKPFFNCLRRKGYGVVKIDYRILHLGEPKTIKELLMRQCRSEVFIPLSFLLSLTPLGFLLFFRYYPWYQVNRNKIKTSFFKLCFLFWGFIAVHGWATFLKKIFGEEWIEK